MTRNERMVQAKKILSDIFGDTSVDRLATRDDLQVLADEIEMYVDALEDNPEGAGT
jgi:hypothetical protein